MKTCKYIVLCIVLFSQASLDANYIADGQRCSFLDEKFEGRGINLTLTTKTSINELVKLSDWGVKLVRIVIHYDRGGRHNFNLIDSATGEFNVTYFAKLDFVLEYAEQNDMDIILDMHTYPGVHNGSFWSSFQRREELKRVWKYIAHRYIDVNSIMAYELINEPNLYKYAQKNKKLLFTDSNYFRFVADLVDELRSIDSKKFIIVAPVGRGGHPSNFKNLKPIDSCKIVYTFHFYVPHEITHARNISDGNYDSKKYRSRLTKSLEYVKIFQKKYDVPVFVGEFGISYNSDVSSANDWLEDAISLFEINGWSWAYWSFSIPFRAPDNILSKGMVIVDISNKKLLTLKRYWAL